MKTRPPQVLISVARPAPLRIPLRAIRQVVAFVGRSEDMRIAEVDIAIIRAAEMAAHNRRFLGRSGPTDVISFDLSGQGQAGLCAQLIICSDLAVQQGPPHRQTPGAELLLYVIHGLLHLMGYDDQTVRSAAAMHARQNELLCEFLVTSRR